VNGLPNPNGIAAITLNTLGKAARALGRKVKIELVPV
jgi:hypothetical protein